MKQYESIQKKLESKCKELEHRIKRFKNRPGRMKKAVNPDFQEQAVERQNDDVANLLNHKAYAELQKIKQALIRIKNDQYGFCVSCGNKISMKRLEALPDTDRCISCAS